MNKQVILLFVTLLVASAMAQRHMMMHVHSGQIGIATRVNAEGVCVNTMPRPQPFLSGRAGGAYTCTVFQMVNCNGLSLSIDSRGRNFFNQGAFSIRC